MNNIFRMTTEEECRQLLSQARQVALSALQEYDLAWTRICYIQQSDTITFKIETEEDRCYLLRIHINGMSKEVIESELMWLNGLSSCADVTVPTAIVSRAGLYVVEVVTDQDVRMCVTLMKWLEGELSDNGLTDHQVMNAGAMMARLHEAAATFTPPYNFKRPTWGIESFRKEMTRLELYYERFLSKEAWKSYQEAAEKIEIQLTSMKRNERHYGIIHADLHLGNIIFKDDQPFPIDFGRCGYGYHLYDIAGTLVGLHPYQRRLFIQGYESVRELEVDYEQNLSGFFVMFMIENFCHHAPNPRETSSLIEEQPYAQAIIRDYLNGSPFLFNPIELIEIDNK